MENSITFTVFVIETFPFNVMFEISTFCGIISIAFKLSIWSFVNDKNNLDYTNAIKAVSLYGIIKYPPLKHYNNNMSVWLPPKFPLANPNEYISGDDTSKI